MKMSEQPEQVSVPSTHSGEAFVDFAYDLLEYTISKVNIHWIKPSCHERRTEKVFVESFGDAVILYHEMCVLDIRADTLIEREKRCDIMKHVMEFCEETFTGEDPLMEFIHYCALIFDIGSLELEYGGPCDIYSLADKTSEVFDKFVKPHFTKLGGWDALYRKADEFVKMANSSPPADDSTPRTTDSDESASDVG